MDRHEIDYIVKCLPKDRTILHYFRDRYALELLASYVDSPKAIREVKQSPLAGLLNKPVVQQAANSSACPASGSRPATNPIGSENTSRNSV